MVNNIKSGPRHEQLSEGNGGWVRYQSDVLAAPAFVRFEDRDGRLVPVDLFLAALDGSIDTSLLRALPMARIEAWANQEQVASGIRARLSLPGPDLRRAASHYSTTFGARARPTWVTRMLSAQMKGSGEPQQAMGELAAPLPELDMVGELTDDELAGLEAPQGRVYPDAFYRQVAIAYGLLARRTRNPVTTIAKANNVPLSTVQRWVREARLRGFLPAAQAGKRG